MFTIEFLAFNPQFGQPPLKKPPLRLLLRSGSVPVRRRRGPRRSCPAAGTDRPAPRGPGGSRPGRRGPGSRRSAPGPPRAVAHRHRHGAIQFDHRRRFSSQQAGRTGRRSGPSRSRPRWLRRHARPRSPPGTCRGRTGATPGPARPATCPSAICPGSRASGPDLPADHLAVGEVRAARRDSCSSISASKPERLRLGQQLDQQPAQADRLARKIGPRQRLARRRGVAFVEHQIDHLQHRIQPLGQIGPRRHLVGNARVANLRLGAHDPLGQRRRGGEKALGRSLRSSARTLRAASARPALPAAAPGWQQVKISRRRSSSTLSSSEPRDVVRSSASSRSASSPSDASNRARRRIASIALNRPAETSHARGLAGTPSRGHCSTAAANASCSASSARSKSPSRRISVAKTRRDSAR